MFTTTEAAIRNFESKVVRIPIAGCWLWTRATYPNGYGSQSYKMLFKNEHGYAHRVAWLLYRGPIPAGMHVLHKCDVRCCVNPDHLFIGTRDDNMADMRSKRRHAIGGRHGMAKLTRDQVLAIRSDTRKLKDIAKAYKMSGPHISDIRRKIYWPDA